MRKAVTSAISFALVLVIGWQSRSENVVVSGKVTSTVNVREEPALSGAEIGDLGHGEAAELIRNLERWREVRLSDGRTGFVSRRWTRVISDLPVRQEEELRVHFLSVGAGTCTVVECPGPNTSPLVYDCGTVGGLGPLALDGSELKTRIEAILAAHAADPHVIASHGDQDHYSHISTALADIQARSIWLGGQSSSFSSFGFPDWLSSQETGGATVHSELGRHFHNEGDPLGDQLQCGLADVYVLTNSSHDLGQSNDPDNADTLMLMIEYDEFSTIFSGDAEGETEDQSVANFGDTLQTTVLMGSHHGATSHQSNDTDWAAATKPDVTIFSAGTRFGHPKCAAVSRYRPHLRSAPRHRVICDTNPDGSNTSASRNAEYMTHTNGTIVVTTDGTSPLHIWCEGTSPGCDTHLPF